MEKIANPISFGTDGWRGIIAEDFTFANLRTCSQGLANLLIKIKKADRGVVVGYDTRFSSKEFAEAVAEVLTGNGIRTFLTADATPTPVISYGVICKKAASGVVITASHNPARWNGFKYKSADGASAPVEDIKELEAEINTIIQDGGEIKRITLSEAKETKLLEVIDFYPEYYEQIKNIINLDEIKNSGVLVAVDSMHGAGSGYLNRILSGGKIFIEEINAESNPAFPNMKQPEPIEPNLSMLCEMVKEEGFHIGIATDGDADRLGIVDENGCFINQLQTFALLALYLLEVKGERGDIVRALTTTSMVHDLAEEYGIKVHETKVGFKSVAPVMLEYNAILGGEESGGYGFRGHIPERDAIVAALCFLDFMVKTGKTPSELLSYLNDKVGEYFYDRRDYEFPPDKRGEVKESLIKTNPKELCGISLVSKDTFDGFRFKLKDGSWLLIRFSGTEPLIRIYAEAKSAELLRYLLDEGKKLAGL